MTPLARTETDASEHLARKFVAYIPLTPGERLIVRDLAPEIRHVRRRENLVVEGNKSHTVFLLIEGIMMRYRILRDGRRQVGSLIIPGDFAGVPSCFFEGALYSIKAITRSTVAPISIRGLHGLFATHPRLAAKIFWAFSCDTAIYAEHLVVIGRRTALERVAYFLLELLTRLQVAGLADQCSYQLPLSQEMISDAIGLSPGYVNRVMRKIIDEGLVTFRDQKITINDVDALSTLADFKRGYLTPVPISQYAYPIGDNWATSGEINSFGRVM